MTNEHFPAHGSMIALTGFRGLHLPVIRLYSMGNPTYRHFESYKKSGRWLQFRSPFRTLRLLAICLRDLHREIREITPLFNGFEDLGTINHKQGLEFTRYLQGLERSEVFLIAAFTLLRRLGDELIDTSRIFLFKDWERAANSMIDACKDARNNRLRKLNPICNVDVLTNALSYHTRWFERLTRDGGIRNILIHRPHILQVNSGATQAPDELSRRWRVAASLVYENSDNKMMVLDIFSALVECVEGVCKFMECLCISVNLVDGYQRDDHLFLSGEDNDIVGFWPPIGALRTEFPLMS